MGVQGDIATVRRISGVGEAEQLGPLLLGAGGAWCNNIESRNNGMAFRYFFGIGVFSSCDGQIAVFRAAITSLEVSPARIAAWQSVMGFSSALESHSIRTQKGEVLPCSEKTSPFGLAP